MPRGYFELIEELRAFRDEHLRNERRRRGRHEPSKPRLEPSNRRLAQEAGVSPSTLGKWLKGKQFPQNAEALVKALRLLAAHAEDRDVTVPEGILDLARWREAYQAESQNRAVGRHRRPAITMKDATTVLKVLAGAGEDDPRLRQADFWTACESLTEDPAVIRELADAAQERGLLRIAARLHKRAAERGDSKAAIALITRMRSIVPGGGNPAWQYVGHVTGAHDVRGVCSLMRELWSAGVRDYALELAGRAAVNAELADPGDSSALINALLGIGAGSELDVFLKRDPAGNARLDNPCDVVYLVDSLWQAKAGDAAVTLVGRLWAHADVSDPRLAVSVAEGLSGITEAEAVHLVARDFIRRCDLTDPRVAEGVLYALGWTEADEEIQAFLDRDPVSQVRLDNDEDVRSLIEELKAAGAWEEARALRDRIDTDDGTSRRFRAAGRPEDGTHLHRFGYEPDGRRAGPWGWPDLN